MSKITKHHLLKAIQMEANSQTNSLQMEHEKILYEAKYKYFMYNYSEEIKQLQLLGRQALDKEVSLTNKISEDGNVTKCNSYNNGLIYKTVTEKSLVDYLMSSYYFNNNSSITIIKHAQSMERENTRMEWSKLRSIIQSMTVKQGLKFLEDSEIELPELKEIVEEKALVNYQVDTSLLFKRKG